jgi:hypothetical protein
MTWATRQNRPGRARTHGGREEGLPSNCLTWRTRRSFRRCGCGGATAYQGRIDGIPEVGECVGNECKGNAASIGVIDDGIDLRGSAATC